MRPGSDEASAAGTARGSKGQTTTDPAIVADLAGQRKALVTMQAKAALCGCELHELAAGGFLLSRWGLTRELRSIDEVQALLAQMGGAA